MWLIMVVNFLALIWLDTSVLSITPSEDIYTSSKELGLDCTVKWGVEKKNGTIQFHLACRTLGFVGFGISSNGGMRGADIVVAGVYENGTTYIQDRHGIGNSEPVIDNHPDYKLLSAAENETHTVLEFSRLLKTCDDQDVEITDDTQYLIWALGTSDNVQYHKTNRGSVVINLLDRQIPPPTNLGPRLRLDQNIILNGNDTMYWCKIHKSPLKTKHHITGFEIYQNSSLSLEHTHHASILRCTPPNGQDPDEFFSQFSDQEYDCYYSDVYYPTEYCKFFEFQWAYGGTVTTFPEELGVPVGEARSQYYMSMFHINNPERFNGTQFSTGVDLHYTNELREMDIGFLQLGINSSKAYALTVPPNTEDYVLSSHCPAACTQGLPEGGISVFVYLLHFHLSGRRMRIRHFRDGQELPWIAKDDNYDTNYQMSRMMRSPIKIMPQDHLTVECAFETKWLNGSTVIGGRSINDEMCQAFLMYYPRVDSINRCGSGYPQDKMIEFMGIEDFVLEKGENDPIILKPSEMYLKPYTEVVSQIDWTQSKRAEFQKLTRFGMHVAECTSLPGIPVKTKYPDVGIEYGVGNQCRLNASSAASGLALRMWEFNVVVIFICVFIVDRLTFI